ncbi:type 1 glutamine amidotransferase domain-containing protein [Streptomyces flavofungini]|uniref:type 1 glutamine amidotransferase domain-containing protein n=1 Tax=Streptomyces flavofungini TaxID=68200 RepID=UPI0025AF0321|nr:type 1 glutamine amidotransferase domain-containing protein [Streptomyces flavofungini]WJV50553.1 type 1 glutamine amidotransferase domain-containing protein [Streptomyces flavofungini]
MTDRRLEGRSVLTLVTNYGVEQDELFVPLRKLQAAGADVTVAAVSTDPVRTLQGDKDPGESMDPDVSHEALGAAPHDLLLIPGGTLNADHLRLERAAVDTVKAFAASGRPVAAICHGPWALVEADVVRGKTLTSYPSLRTDITNAGAKSWVDEPVVVDPDGDYPLITSRTPKDLDAFVSAICGQLGGS